MAHPFVLSMEMLDPCQRLGSFKFIHEKECPFGEVNRKVHFINRRHYNGWKFATKKVNNGTHIILVDKGEFTLEDDFKLNKNNTLYMGTIKKWSRFRNIEIRDKIRKQDKRGPKSKDSEPTK